jgi:hypothetical protein
MKIFAAGIDESSVKFIKLCTATRRALLVKSKRKELCKSKESLHSPGTGDRACHPIPLGN